MEFPDRRTSSVVLTLLSFALGLTLIYVARAIIVVFAFSILFAYLINPVVRFLQRHSLFFKNLRGPHVLEAYLAFLFLIALVGHTVAPELQRHPDRFFQKIPALADRISSGEIAGDLGTALGWSDGQSLRLRAFLQEHRSEIRTFIAQGEQFASTAVGGILVIPILAIFFLSDGENMTKQVIRLVSTERNYQTIRSLAAELDFTLQRYIRAKVILGGLSLGYCSVAMFVLGFPNALTLGVMAGVLEFIPVAGWMISAATIVSFGILTHSHWIWMLALLGLWRVLMDYWIAPRVMGHELEIHPLLAIFTMMVGGAVGGIIGIYLSVPLVATLGVVWRRLTAPPLQTTTVEELVETAALESD
jgi:predicted PurR-regulated permease PerM